MNTNTKSWILPALLGGVAVITAAQSQPQLTPREFFYVPKEMVDAKAKKTGGDSGAVAATKKQTKKNTTQVAVTNPATNVEPPETRQEQVKLVQASYKGPAPLGLKYTILRRIKGEETYRPVNVDTVFHSGDSIRLKVEANEGGYLYIINRGTSGKWNVLFPHPQINGGDNRISAYEEVPLPSRRGWTFDDNKGKEQLFVVLARTPVGDLDKFIYDLNETSKPAAAQTESKKPAAKAKPAAEPEKQPAKQEPKRVMLAQSSIAPIDDALVGGLRTQMLSRDLVFEKVDEETEARVDKAAYYVEKSGKADARVMAEINLVHQ